MEYISMENTLNLLIQYKYLILFPLAIVEGPVLAVIGGFLCSSGYLNPFILYPLILLGDLIGDSFFYFLGWLGIPEVIKRIASRLGLVRADMESIRSYYEANAKKTISLSKLTLGIGIAGLYLAGNSRIPYNKFLIICMITSALQYVVYIGIGMLFGAAYRQISRYIDFFSAFIFVFVLAVILIYLVRARRKKL